MLQKFIRNTRIWSGTVPRVDSRDFKAKDMEHNMETLSNMYYLRTWSIENTKCERKKNQYIKDVEEIHNEMIFLNTQTMNKRFAILIVGLSFLVYLLFDDENTRTDFQSKWDRKYLDKMYSELDEGGRED